MVGSFLLRVHIYIQVYCLDACFTVHSLMIKAWIILPGTETMSGKRDPINTTIGDVSRSHTPFTTSLEGLEHKFVIHFITRLGLYD